MCRGNTCEEGLVLGASHSPTSRSRGPSASQFGGFLSIYAYTLTELSNLMWKHIWGGGLFLEISHAVAMLPPQWGGAPALRKFGVLSTYAYTLCRRTTKFDVQVTHVGYGRVPWGQPRLPSQDSGVPGLSNFWGSPVFMPTFINAERPNSAW